MTSYYIYIYLGVFGVFVFFLSFYITSYVRNYSLRNNVIDVPNERSSHVVPTPTGGGVAISLSIILSVFVFGGDWIAYPSISLALGIGVIVIGIVGWIDIHKEVAVLTRAIIYLLVSITALILLGGMSELSFGLYHLGPGWLASLLAIIGITWLVNLYNFMDGTDGLAAVQALSTGLYGTVVFMSSDQIAASVICLTVFFSTLGFLVWNWAPAKIFMGDVGSCSIGFTFGVLAVYGEISGSVPVIIWLILLSIFISDASMTLMKRILSGETWYRAHNTHAYQRLVQLGMGHGRLAMYTLCANIFVIGPLAYLAWRKTEYSLQITVCLYVFLALIWLQVHRVYSRRSRCQD